MAVQVMLSLKNVGSRWSNPPVLPGSIVTRFVQVGAPGALAPMLGGAYSQDHPPGR